MTLPSAFRAIRVYTVVVKRKKNCVFFSSNLLHSINSNYPLLSYIYFGILISVIGITILSPEDT